MSPETDHAQWIAAKNDPPWRGAEDDLPVLVLPNFEMNISLATAFGQLNEQAQSWNADWIGGLGRGHERAQNTYQRGPP